MAHDDLKGAVLMIVLMVVVSYFILSNVMLIGPFYNHLNKLYMALLMGTAMGAIVAVTMPLPSKSYLYGFLFGSIALSVVLIWLIRRQVLISKEQFAKGMVEHHEMAILMSRRVLVHTKNEAVKQLAREIISSQQREIDQMVAWIRNGFPANTSLPLHQQTSRQDPWSDIMHQMMMRMQQLPHTGSIDRDFLMQMIPHHQAAVEMANFVLQHNNNNNNNNNASAQVNALAQHIITSQSAETSAMHKMLSSLQWENKPVQS
jgi:uncharacterized protein (DUF305 family)